MDKFKKYNELLCEEFCEEMKKFEATRHPEHLKAVKDLAETWADLQCIEAGYAMRKIAERKYGWDMEMADWDEEDIYSIFNASRGGRGGRRSRDSRGRFVSNRGGNRPYNEYEPYNEMEDDDMDSMNYPYPYIDEAMYPMYNRQGGGRDGRGGRSGQGNRSGHQSGGRGGSREGNGSYNEIDPNQMYMLRQRDGMPIYTPYNNHEASEPPKKLTKEQIEKWMDNLENEDGTTGEHWSEQEVKQFAQKAGIKPDGYSEQTLYAATNMMYSDYCETLEKFGVHQPEVYICLAQDFLEDEDFKGSPEEKLALYYHCIANKK